MPLEAQNNRAVICSGSDCLSPAIALDSRCISFRRGAVEKKTVLENLDLVLLAMDETVDGGCASADLTLSFSPTADTPSFLKQPGGKRPCILQTQLPGQSCDRVILETDAATIAGRVSMRGADNDIPLAEQVLHMRTCSALLI